VLGTFIYVGRSNQVCGRTPVLTEVVVTQWRELLAEDDSAVVRVSDGDGDERTLQDLAAAHGRRLLILDLQDSESEHDILAAVAEAFDMDRDADVDWDTLDEALSEYEVTPESGLVVCVSEWESLVENREETLATIVDVLRTAARAWEDEGVPWLVLVSGDGPSFGLPWIGSGSPPWLKAQDPGDDVDDGIEIELEDDEDW